MLKTPRLQLLVNIDIKASVKVSQLWNLCKIQKFKQHGVGFRKQFKNELQTDINIGDTQIKIT